MSCVCASAFLHVFYVSCLCVVKPFSLWQFVCTWAHMYVSLRPCVSVFCACLFMSLVHCSKYDVFYMRSGQWKSHTLRRWDLSMQNDAHDLHRKWFRDTYMHSRLTPISQSITLRGRVRKCYYSAVEPRKTMQRLWSYQALCTRCHVKTSIQSPFSLAKSDVTLLFEWPFKIKWTNKSGLSWKISTICLQDQFSSFCNVQIKRAMLSGPLPPPPPWTPHTQPN